MNKDLYREKIFTEFSAFLSEKMGLYYPKKRWSDLESKLTPLSQSFGFNDIKDFLTSLMSNLFNKKQISILAYHLTIGETYFFRNPQTFKILKNTIFPELLKRKELSRSIRIWSAGCCTGEEPYSIAMILHQLIPNLNSWNIRLIGSDINTEFLDKAKQGIYGKWSLRATPREVIKKYFVLEKKGLFHLVPEIKEMVNFIYLNLAEDEYPSIINNLLDVDLILCNNVLIYFSEEQIKKTVQRFVNTLANQGWLNTAVFEVPFINNPNLKIHPFDGISFFRKTDHSRAILNGPIKHSQKPRIPILETLTPQSLKRNKPLIEPSTPTSKHIAIDKDKLYQECYSLYQRKLSQEAIDKLTLFLSPYQKNKEILKNLSNEVILLIRLYANQGNFSQALAWCKDAINANKLNPTLYYIQGEIQLSSEETKDALGSIKKALFLDPDFVTAHYMLGVIEQKQNNIESSLREFKTTLELIKDYHDEDILPGTEDLSARRIKDLLNHYGRT